MANDDNEPTSGQLIMISEHATLPSFNISSVLSLPKLAESISFSLNNELLFEIKGDGQIVKGPAFTTEDEMSLKFWELIMDNFGLAWWRGLVKRR